MLHPVSRLWRGRLSALVTVASLLALPSAASAAPLEIKKSFVGPVTGLSQCTSEAKLPANHNDGLYNPLKPTYWSTADNLGGFEDMQQRPEAGTFGDLCVGFRLDPYTQGSRAGGVGGAGPANPATAVATGDDLKDLSITLPAGYGARLASAPVCSEADFGLTPDGYIAFVSTGGRPAAVKRVAADPANGYDVQPIWDTPAQCPDSALIGTASARAANPFSLLPQVLIGGGMYTADIDGIESLGGGIWQLPPGPNELARLGVQLYLAGLTLPIKFTVSVRLATDGSGRLVSVVQHAPRVAMILPLSTTAGQNIYMESVAITLWGKASEHTARTGTDIDGNAVRWPVSAQDMAETPTRCDRTATGSIVGETYGGVFNALPSTYTPTPLTSTIDGVAMTGCDQLPFSPAVDVTTTEHRPGVPTGVDVKVRVDQAPSAGGRLPSQLKDAVVTLPAGLELGGQVASGANGLTFCHAADFADSDVTVASACPAATEAATVSITTPLISRKFTGKVWLGDPAAGELLPQLYLEASVEGSSGAGAPRIKLIGNVKAADDGKLTTTFSDAPELRWSELALSFPGGDHALFVTPQRCGTTTGQARMTPWSGQPDVAVATSGLTIDQQCSGAAAPKLAVSATDTTAGKKSPSRVVITRDPSAPWMKQVNAHLPSGFLADLNSAGECPAAKAAVGDCAADSRIGSVTTWAGAGSAPFQISGDMFLAERKGSDVAGAVIVVNAKVGDLDLGKVIVPGRILLRPTDAGLDFITDVPLRVHGVALQLQKVQVDLDRPNFALNPSACGPLDASVDLTDDKGAATKGTGSATYTGCKALAFSPKLKAILTGDNTPGGHPGMYVVLTSPEGESAMKTAAVTLPDGVITDGANIKNACSPEAFSTSSCPANTRVGTATANVSIVPDPLVGDIYLVNVPGKALPGLGLDFKGRYAQRVLGNTTTDKTDRIVATFPTIPDLPLRKLVIDVATGPKAPLLISENEPCAAGSSWQGVFTGQGGQTSSNNTGLQCAATPKTTLSTKAGLSLRLFDFGTRKLKYLKATLPKGWSFNAKAAAKADGTWVRMTGGTGTIKLTKTSLYVTATGDVTDVRLKVAGTALRHPRSVKKGTKINVPLRLAFTDGAVQEQQLTLTAK